MERTTGRGACRFGTSVYVAIGVVVVVLACVGLAVFARGGTVLHHAAAPDGRLIAVCEEVRAFDGPSYTIRLERPDGGHVRDLYEIGDGDPCSEVVWSPDGMILAVLSGHVTRARFVDVGWALGNMGIPTRYWSWRQVDLSNERRRVRGSGLRFVNPRSVEIQVCSVNTVGECVNASTRRFDVPARTVTVHPRQPG